MQYTHTRLTTNKTTPNPTQEEMACFTLDPAASPLHVCRMGFLGEMWCVAM